jgi:thiol-disulfide isomerase/thioredoxin
MFRPRALIAGLIAASVALTTPSFATPPVFKEMSYEQAVAAAASKKKILIFDAMTSWCGPCKVMDKTTWVDDSVVSWISENAVAIQLDMDQHKELGQTLRINAYPTIIAFKDGKEFDRLIGLKRAPEFLAWLKGVAQGESKLDQALKAVKEERALSTPSYARRLALAEDLYEYSSYDEATAECAWLWENMPAGDPTAFAERSTMLASLMGNLARRHPAAKTRFTAFRDAAAKPVRAGSPTQAELTTWLTLNAVVADQQSTVDWALKMTDTPANLGALRAVGHTVFPLLVEGGHWEAAGKALANPVGEINDRGSQLGAYDLPVGDATPAAAGTIPAMPLTRTPAGAGATPGTTPAIPLVRKGEPAAAPTEPAEKPKSIPAIPLMRKAAPAEPAATAPNPPAPVTPSTTPPAPGGEATKPKSVPAIPIMRKPAAVAAKDEPIQIPEMGAPATFAYDDPASMAREVRYRLTLEFRDQAATYYAACLAAGRDAEAAQIAELTFRYTDTPASRMALAERALRAGKPLPQHLVWMQEIEAAGQTASTLRAKLERATKP